jgi:L-alanine-DL-glutamate epimerase-like enolase superfamily enzyme
MTLSVRAYAETWPIAGSFVISRGSRTEARVVVAEISDGTHIGRGECVPYPRYSETIEGVLAEINAAEVSTDRQALRRTMKAGAARNALDCALWDLEAKRVGKPAWALAGLAAPKPVVTCYTLSLGTPESMADAARAAAEMPLLKIKLGGDGDAERIRAVRAAAPSASIVVDANEAWSEANFDANMRACGEADVALIEQPLPAGADDFLRDVRRTVPICADESVHVTADLETLVGKYDGVNIKLDKAGGLTEALDLVREARRRDFRIMVGCMLATSLAMAPAMLIAQQADIVDLDGPLLLAKDRVPGLAYSGALVSPPDRALWG